MKYCGFAGGLILVLGIGLAIGAPQGNPEEKASPMPVRVSFVLSMIHIFNVVPSTLNVFPLRLSLAI